MKYRVFHLFALFMAAALVLAGCLSDKQTSNLEADAVGSSVPALVKLQQKNVLEYVISSSRLTSAPPSGDWQLDADAQSNGGYRFRSGSWLMVILPATDKDGNQQVIIIETVKDSSWCGVIQPDGSIIDTCFRR